MRVFSKLPEVDGVDGGVLRAPPELGEEGAGVGVEDADEGALVRGRRQVRPGDVHRDAAESAEKRKL